MSDGDSFRFSTAATTAAATNTTTTNYATTSLNKKSRLVIMADDERDSTTTPTATSISCSGNDSTTYSMYYLLGMYDAHEFCLQTNNDAATRWQQVVLYLEKEKQEECEKEKQEEFEKEKRIYTNALLVSGITVISIIIIILIRHVQASFNSLVQEAEVNFPIQ